MSEQYEIVERLLTTIEVGMVRIEPTQAAREAASLIQAMAEALEPFAERANEIEAYGKRSDHSTAAVELGALRLARSVLALLKGSGT